MSDTFDWDKFEIDDGIPWQDFYDKNLSYPANFMSFLKRSIALKEEEVVSKIIASYAVCNSKAAKILPILWVYGPSGTAKSDINYLCAAFRNEQSKICGSSSTFASIRNLLQEYRWRVIDNPLLTSLANEKPYIMVWADIKESNFTQGEGKMYALFRNGIDRTEDKIFISAGDGTNIPFHVFGLKVVSTIENFFLKPEWSELYRRCLFVKTFDFKQLDPEFVKEWKTRDFIDLKNISWNGIEDLFDEHWSNERLIKLQNLYKNKSRIIKTHGEALDAMNHHRLKISWDLLIQGYVSGIFDGFDDAFETFEKYWKYVDVTTNESQKPVLQMVLEQVVESSNNYSKQINDQFLRCGRPDLVRPATLDTKTVKSAITEAQNNGVLGRISNQDITNTMFTLGWEIAALPKGFEWRQRID